MIKQYLAAIQSEIQYDLESIRSFIILLDDYALVFTIQQLIYQYFGSWGGTFPSSSTRALLARYLVTWQAMGARDILEKIVGRVTQYVDERYLAAK